MATKSKTKSSASPDYPSAPELIVIAAPGAGLRSRAAEVASTAGASTKGLNALLKAAGAEMTPIFGSEPRVRLSRAAAAVSEAADLPELSGYYNVRVNPDKMEELAAELLNDPSVEAAYVKPAPQPPVWLEQNEDVAEEAPDGAEAPTASFLALQTYLEVAPGGIDARYAWTRAGGKGQGVRIIDIEGAWRFTHEDLLQNQGGVIGGTQSADIGWRNHGTAVVGVFGGDENAFGVTGIAPLANTRAISIFGGLGTAAAIRQAADALSPGDIILIELHAPGPDASGTGQDGYIAMEWWPDNFAAILYATAKGVIVVEAAGNGSRNLDAAIFDTKPAGFPASWKNPFRLSNPQSGAILVGAGAPPPGTHGNDHGPDRSRLAFSNHGARVNAQGWGREVTTAGYGDLQGGANENLWYTNEFSGTSSASPVVVGAIACLQGALRAASKPLLTPATARSILETTGSAQQDAPGRPATQRIGKRPNLRQALNQLLPVIKPIKELKVEKLEKIERKEIKELKVERKEIKELKVEKNEKIEQKEFKEKPEKEIFEKIPDKALEKIQDKALEKIQEKGLELQNQGLQDLDIQNRLSQLEQSVASLSHFIPAELRPDLGASAFRQEEDLQAQADQMAGDVEEAKAAKDVRDVC